MKKAKRLITIFLSLSLVLINILGNGAKVYAAADVIITEPEVIELVPGETKKVRIPIKAVGEIIQTPIIMAEAADAPFRLSQPKLTMDGFDTPPNIISPYATQHVEVEITVDETAKIGVYPFKLLITGTSYGIDGAIPVSTSLTVNTQILEEKEPAQLTVNKVTFSNSTIGEETNLSFTVKNEGEITARNVYASIDYGDTGMAAGYSTKNIKLENIAKQGEELVRVPVKILSSATLGMKTLTVNLTYKSEDGKSFTESHDIYINLRENDNAPKLILDGFTYTKGAKPGDKLGLTLKIKNEGRSTAVSSRISVDESSIGTSMFIKDFFTDYIELYNINADQTKKIEIPLIVSKEAKGGLKDLKLNLVYLDEDGVEYKETVTVYPDIEGEGVSEDGVPVVIVSNVKQSPERPVAGGKLEVSFDIENKSTIDLNEFKLQLKNLTANTFIPISSDPYQYIGVIKAGTTKRVTISLNVSENVPEGLNTLLVGFSYVGGSDSVEIPVRNVENDTLDGTSKPRLIVSNYDTDVEQLKAGDVFNLAFEIRNTHSSVAAKNIIISISGKAPGGQEVFSVTQGSNNFFVNKIGAGETFSGTLEMKVKSDTATNAYPIFVNIEYEYDGIEPNPTTGEIGEKEQHELNLQVAENARPVVDYVQVYSWDGGVIVNSPATLAFEFYNMGKSMLNNVIATVEGDFINSSGNMYFMGNVNAGDRSYAEFEVLPTVEGMARGTVRITYEDSNGDEQVYTKEFETNVMGEQTWNPDVDGGGIDVFNPDTAQESKKPILKTWIFVVIQVVIFIAFIPITRKIIISVYKNKLRKKEENMM